MEDESRPLPQGWVRQLDPQSNHQFFVDTATEPPRSIWHHPYDDDAYMSSLAPEERGRIDGLHRVPSEADVIAESSDDDNDFHNPKSHAGKGEAAPQGQGGHHTGEIYPNQLPRRDSPPPKGIHKFGRKMKDKITSSTHQEREQMRQQREAEEQQLYERYQIYRSAMAKAAQTGEPQLIGKDKDGRDVYMEPPFGRHGGRGGMIGGGGPYPGQGGVGHGGMGYNPYQNGVYGAPNARYIRPQNPYNRRPGYGYGGGLGLPLGLGIGGGLLAGSLLF